MDRLANSVILSWGWRRRIIAFAAGALSSLAMPPFFIFPILFLTFPVLVWLLDGAVAQGRSGRIRRLAPAFATGWWFGFGYFVAGLWWVGAAFLVEAEDFALLMPLAVIGLPAGLALFWGLGAAFAQIFWGEDWRRVFALAAGLGGAEWLRGHLFTGFPWNSIGYALTSGEILMQSSALMGVYGLSVVAVAIFAAPAALAPAHGGTRRHVALPVCALLALAGLGLYGIVRLANAPAAFQPDVTVRIVQPALSQLQKWDPAEKDAVLARYFELSMPAGAQPPAGTLLVWPESAFPFPLMREPGILAAIAELLPEGTALVTGAYREEPSPDGPPLFFNSIHVIGPDGTILATYDKTHLVPFGEYLPAASLFGRLEIRQLTFESFSPGAARHSLTPPFGPAFLPLICYEAIFSGEAVANGGDRPGFMLNVTNDGWFGRTTGPYQHLHQARVRAVEEGIPLVRAANTGISAVTDAYGRIVASAALGQSTMIEAPLPVAAPATVYAGRGHLAFVLLLVASMIISATNYFYRVSPG